MGRVASIARILAAVLGLAVMPLHAVTVEQLTRTPFVTDVELSPDGDHLALRIYHQGEHMVVFVDRETLKQVGGHGIREDGEVGDFHWVNDERIVGQVLGRQPHAERPVFYGELFATNIDGSHYGLLFGGPRQGLSVGIRPNVARAGMRSRRRGNDRGWASIIDVLPNDEKHILISVTPWSVSFEAPPRVELLNVHSGLQREIEVPSKYPDGAFFTDRDGRVRAIASVDEQGRRHLQTRPLGGEWKELTDPSFGADFWPVAVSGDSRALLALDNPTGNRRGLYRLSLHGGSYERLYEHERVDVTKAIMSSDGRSVYALRLDDGRPSYVIVDPAHEEAKFFRQLLDMYPEQFVSIESRSRDGRFWVVRTGSDVDGGRFRVVDREARRVTEVAVARPEVLPGVLAPMRPVSFPSFDGTTVHGFFTPATTGEPDEAPMVVYVHGGPGTRDYWGYDPVVQVLATRGFSVLQINYRGSTGYGKVFADAGRRQWGDAVQQDVITGTRWAVEEGLAGEGRVCIMGGSFGAYSAMMSAILAPDLYACVVANAGVYDLPLMYERGDIAAWYGGERYLEQQIGGDEAELARYSPVNRVDELRIPVFLAHGRQDRRAPLEHARRLKRALDRHDKPYRWFVKGREGHGFYDNRNQVQYLEAVLVFLRKHLMAPA